MDLLAVGHRLRALGAAVAGAGSDIALSIVYDRPSRVEERPGLAASHFAQRCVSEEQIEQFTDAFRSVGAVVEVFDGEISFIEALASGRVQAVDRRLRIVYNGLESGIAPGGFAPGRRSLIPAVADAFGLLTVGSDAHACALARHKYHWSSLLRHWGLPVPRTWHHALDGTWAAGERPPVGERVIVKSTYESWSVGVTASSVFVVDDRCDERVADIARQIGQAVTVQRFVNGAEVCVPVFSDPERFTSPPMRSVLTRAPDDGDAYVTIEDNLRAGGVVNQPFDRPEVAGRLDEVAIAAFDLLGLKGFGRIDFRVTDGGDVSITDVGADPGLPAGAAAARSAAQAGVDHATFLRAVVGATLAVDGLLPERPALPSRPGASAG